MHDLAHAVRSTRTGSTTKGPPSGFTHLDRLRNMLGAYVTACVELVWRREMAELLEEKSTRLTEALAGFLGAERGRRRAFEQADVAVLPQDVNVFARRAAVQGEGTPDFEFSVRAGAEDVDGRLTRQDVDGESASGCFDMRADG